VRLRPSQCGRAKLLSAKEKLRAFRWSSYGEYLKAKGQRLPWLRVDRLLGEHGIPKDTAAGREQSRPEWSGGGTPRTVRISKRLSAVVSGSEAFRKELLAQMSQQAGAEHYGRNPRIGPGKGRTDNCRRLKTNGLGRIDLERHRKGAPQKLKIALRLRQQTTMTLAWIAQRLQMGTKTHLSHLLYWDERGKS